MQVDSQGRLLTTPLVETVAEEASEFIGVSRRKDGPSLGSDKRNAPVTTPLVETVGEEESECTGVGTSGKRNAPGKSLLAGVAREQRERKATKADDVAVPEYLWGEHLTAGSKTTEWDAKALDDLRRVSSLRRDRMLCWWKRKVFCSYVTCMKLKYELEDSSSSADIVTAKLGGEGQEWRSHGRDCYVWNTVGRDWYKAWWKNRLVKTYKDIVPASDAIARAAKSSWWN
jgi:hypothetical protein